MFKAVAGIRVWTYCREVGLCLNILSMAHVHRAAKGRKAVAGDIYSIEKQQICTFSGFIFYVNPGHLVWSVLCHQHSRKSPFLTYNNKPFFLFSQHTDACIKVAVFPFRAIR